MLSSPCFRGLSQGLHLWRPVLDFAHVGFTLLPRSLSRPGLAVSAAGLVRTGSVSSLSTVDMVSLEPSMPVRSSAQPESPLLAPDLTHVEPLLPVQELARVGPVLLTVGLARMGFVVPGAGLHSC